MTELMKRYESETGKQSAILKFMCGGQALESKAFPKIGPYEYSTEYIEWLEAQLTWRLVSEKPKEGQIVFGMISTGWVVAQYINGEFYVDDGFTFGDRIGGVIEWLPIPPTQEVI